MSGRSRLTASSSAAPASRSSVPWKAETSVLRTIAANTPEDEVPTFELVDAEVLRADGQTLANPLDLQLHGPFIVRGFLMIDDAAQRTHLITQGRRNRIPIKINQVERYSVGIAADDEDSLGFNPPLLWLRGKCCYHEISPAQHYLPIYRQAIEAIAMYYSFEEYYSTGQGIPMKKSSKKSRLRVESLAPLFLHCAMQLGNGWTMDDVTQKCHDLAHFLISQFFTTMPDVLIWENTYFHAWMKQEHKDLYHRIRDAYISGRPQVEKHPADAQRSASLSQTPVPASLPSRIRSSELTPVDTTIKEKATTGDVPAGSGSQRQRSTRSRSLLPEETHVLAERPAPKPKMKPSTSTPTLTSQASMASPAADDEHVEPFESLRLALEGVYTKTANPAKLTEQSIANKIYFDYRWPTYKNGQTGCHKIPVLEVFHYNAAQLLEVLDKARWGGTPFWSWLEAKVEEPFKPVSMTPDKFPYTLVLRKKMENIVRKPKPPPTKLPATHDYGYDEDEDESDVHHDGFETPGRGIGKTPARLGKSALRPAATLIKRALESDSEEDSPIAKRSHFFGGDTEDDQQLANEDEEEDGEAQIKLVVRADRIPSTTPRGPDGTWTCDEENCNYIIRGGDAEDCKERIQQHLATHEQEAERVQLAMVEGTKNHSSIRYAYFPPFIVMINPGAPWPSVEDSHETDQTTPEAPTS
ncbi:uncharacterized protein F5Z01DRAFT_693436 [Emericellopsis atlantica]|uniref:Uncharacterized protein n=1 Tax=Emericellopsis atlantica TaxID=2614577 RepID=A0A9P8CKS5_9HYPO|nr:uncharacterized protein F5Z01DRAFT_693436 [Emericellopsis atlantica]KAG9250874.1 hypothetical protein F5Z01DRAFT_693436 [Emericellopsis atlantica]